MGEENIHQTEIELARLGATVFEGAQRKLRMSLPHACDNNRDAGGSESELHDMSLSCSPPSSFPSLK